MRIVFLLALFSLSAQAAEPTHSICEVKEKRGRQTEEYEFRLAMPSSDTQFNLRLFPKVMLEVGVMTEKKDLPMFMISAYDYELEGETMGEIEVASTQGYHSVRFSTKLIHKPTYELEVNCRTEQN